MSNSSKSVREGNRAYRWVFSLLMVVLAAIIGLAVAVH